MAKLEDFIDDNKEDDDNTTSADTSTNNSNTNATGDVEVGTDNRNDRKTRKLDYDWSKHGTQTNNNAKRNICPACLTSGPKAEGYTRYWSCENDDCGTIMYGGGWFERRRERWSNDDDFLTSINWPEFMDWCDKNLDSV